MPADNTVTKPAAATPPAPPGAAKPFTVTNIKPRLIEIAGHRIGPGQTVEIPPQYEVAVRKSSVFMAKFLVEGRPVLPPSTPIDITKVDVEKAKRLIGIEDDVTVLSAWADADKRPEIVAALQERVKIL